MKKYLLKEELMTGVESYKKTLEEDIKHIDVKDKLIKIYDNFFNSIATAILEEKNIDDAIDLLAYGEDKLDLLQSIDKNDLERYIVISLGLVTGDTIAENGIFKLL